MYAIYFFPRDKKYDRNITQTSIYPLTTALNKNIKYKHFTVGRKFKKFQAKKIVKLNKSISRIFLDQIPFFAISKMPKNQFLNWEKV